MEPKKPSQTRRLSTIVLGGLVLVLFTVLVLLQTSNLWKNLSVDSASDTLLLYALSSLNFIAFVIFGFIFLRSIIKLVRERRSLQLGSRIKTRLLLYFAAISILPIFAMAGFSYLFMNRALERWFTQIPENVVRESREVQDRTRKGQSDKLKFTAQLLASALENRKIDDAALTEFAVAGNLTQIRVVDSSGRVLEQSAETNGTLRLKDFPAESAAISEGNFDDPVLNDGRGIDAAASDLPDGRRLIVIPNLAHEESVSQMAENSLAEFDRLKEQQITVRQVGLLTLGVLTFLLIFASTWTAFYIARGLTVPIKALAEGADEIARGNLAHRVDVFAEDELALLISTFNEMSGKLEENSAELNERKRYIETVLEALPTGVISFGPDDRITTINQAAVSILKLQNIDHKSLRMENIASEDNRKSLEKLISRAKRIGRATEQTTLRCDNSDGLTMSDMPVALTAAALPENGGAVLVIEDLSELIAAQRASAWQEVARRMAHEIKNPLTPIQLSAERIAKWFSRREEVVSSTGASALNVINQPQHTSSAPDLDHTAKVVAEGTNTILKEVRSLKSMVDEFSRFARLPDARLEKGDINSVLTEVFQSYSDRTDSISVILELDDNLPTAMIDQEQLRRVFVNLIENSIEAFDPTAEAKTITLKSRAESGRGLAVIEVIDNGPGVPLQNIQRLFQPYFSTKGRGTGIGLAIVQRIIFDHRGKIRIAEPSPKGARFVIEIPQVT